MTKLTERLKEVANRLDEDEVTAFLMLTAARQIEKNEGYFESICEALDIEWDSSLMDILGAIDKLKPETGR